MAVDKNEQDSPNEDSLVEIGSLHVPLWQYNIYFTESEKFLLELQKEVKLATVTGVSKALVRDVHTLAGISNTLGAEPIAKFGYALEYWLTSLYEEHSSRALTTSEKSLLLAASDALREMVENVRHKQEIQNERKDLIESLQEIDAKNHEKIMNVTLDSEPNADGTPGEDWLSKEMQSLEDTLNFEADPTAGWSIDVDAISLNQDKQVTENPLVQVGEDSNVKSQSVSEEKAKDFVTAEIEQKKNNAPSIPKVDKKIKTEAKPQEIRDYRPYVASLFPTADVVDIVEDSISDIFIEEASDIFDSLPDDIDVWSASHGKDNDKANKIKRALHTLKGSSRMAGYFRFGVAVHNIETVIEVGHPILSASEIPDLIQAGCDALAQELRHIKDASEVSGFVANSELVATPVALKDATAITVNPVEKVVVVKKEVKIKKIAPAAEVAIVKTGMIEFPPSIAQSKKENIQEDANLSTVLRVPTEKIDIISSQLGRSGTIQLRVETAVVRIESQITEMSTNMERLSRLLRDLEISAEGQMKSRMEDAKKEQQAFDPLEFDRFTRLQELTRMTAEAMHDIDNSQQEVTRGLISIQDALAENSILAEDMQHAVMSVRTVPVNSLGRRLEMLIRQACRDTQKQAKLFMESSIEVDSGILNKIVAPLEHLLRNSMAHGIEMPETRIAKGKAAAGSVTLQVLQRGNDIIFKLEDDGAGINRAAVERKAISKGLLKEGEVLTQEKANYLIFDAGFSTSEVANELSGRGVGMDVVASIISEMGGRVVVQSEEGVGSTFELIVPSYMSVISMVPVSARGVKYAVPSALVRDVIVVRDTKVLAAYETGMLDMDEQQYPFYGLSSASGLEAPDIQRNNRVMLVDDQNGVAAIHIDNLEVDRNLVMKPLCRTISSLPGLLGASVAGDGSPLLVINPVQLRASVLTKAPGVSSSKTDIKVERTHSDMTIMVIDDSLTIRRITQKFLARAGFKVVLAIDGLDAIEKIGSTGIPDLFLTDIEMPNMDGFQLTEHIRTSVSKTTPIVMISSRSIEKYSDHAKSLGVNRSLGKPYQEPELLAVIEELVGLKTPD